jgi:RNase P subunit RPR2
LYTPVNYRVDFDTFADEATKALKVEKTDENTRDWHVQDIYAPDENKHQITKIEGEGTYFIDGSPENFITNFDRYDGTIYVATDRKVTIVLYNNTGNSVVVPVISNNSNYQQISTSHGGYEGPYLPNVTFVTAANYVKIQKTNNVGNIIALNATVSFVGQGQHCGTIVCKEIDSTNTPLITEGHIYKYGYRAYLADSRKVKTGSETTYSISGSKEVYTVSGELQNYNITVSKDATRKAVTADELKNKYVVTANELSNYYVVTANELSNNYVVTADELSNKYVVTADELANKYVVTADEVDHKYTVTADTLANKVVLAAKRTVESQTSKATLEKTDYTRTATSLERVFGIQISRYSLASTSDPWIETTVVQIPSQTPPPTLPDIPVTPPETPDVPPTTPDVPPTTPPTIIIDEPTPLASEVAQVLGARRGPAVLGARRGRTDDMAHNPLVSSLIMMGASAAALSLLASLKKRK